MLAEGSSVRFRDIDKQVIIYLFICLFIYLFGAWGSVVVKALRY